MTIQIIGETFWPDYGDPRVLRVSRTDTVEVINCTFNGGRRRRPYDRDVRHERRNHA